MSQNQLSYILGTKETGKNVRKPGVWFIMPNTMLWGGGQNSCRIASPCISGSSNFNNQGPDWIWSECLNYYLCKGQNDSFNYKKYYLFYLRNLFKYYGSLWYNSRERQKKMWKIGSKFLCILFDVESGDRYVLYLFTEGIFKNLFRQPLYFF